MGLLLASLVPVAAASAGSTPPFAAPPPGTVGVHAAQAALAEKGALPPLRVGPPPPAAGAPDKVVYGYLPYWTVSPEDVPWSHLTHLAVFSVGLNSDGSLGSLSHWTDVAADAVARGHEAGVKVHLCVTSFDADTMDAVLGSASTRAAAVQALAAQVSAYGADGVNIDFEGMRSSQIGNLVTFVTALRAQVGEVWLATPAVDWSAAYDYPALAAASDGLFIMGYAYHYTGGGAGPNSPLDDGDIWSKWTLGWTVDDYLATGADPARIVLGLPLYGQAWPVADADAVPATTTGTGWSVFYTSAVDAAATYGRQYDSASDTPWYAASGTEQGWYDDADSLAVKMTWAVDERGLAGVGFWAIGYDGNDPALWDAVDAVSHDVGGDAGDDTGPGDTDGTADTDDTDDPPRARRLAAEGTGCACDHAGPGVSGIVALAGLGLLARRRR
jgi:MYXO-CTERM domain-containing protein